MSTSGTTDVVLVGDVGGTNTRLAIHADSSVALAQQVLPSQSFARLEDAVATFLAAHPEVRPTRAVIGIAGPVIRGVATITNLTWKVEEAALAERFGLSEVVLINDLVAVASGVVFAGAHQVTYLTKTAPAPRAGNIAVIAAGTGLGQARLLRSGDRTVAFASEGGHGDFAPRCDVEVEIWRSLRRRFGSHVSYERVLSGAGLLSLYDFYASRTDPEPPEIAARLATPDRGHVITQLGVSGASVPAREAVARFASVYGAEAGNFALRELAVGGVFVVGAMGRAIVPPMADRFLQAFYDKGRFSEWITALPIAVIVDPMVGVAGALAIARGAVEVGHARA